jgi:hypothetical protein
VTRRRLTQDVSREDRWEHRDRRRAVRVDGGAVAELPVRVVSLAAGRAVGAHAAALPAAGGYRRHGALGEHRLERRGATPSWPRLLLPQAPHVAAREQRARPQPSRRNGRWRPRHRRRRSRDRAQALRRYAASVSALVASSSERSLRSTPAAERRGCAARMPARRSARQACVASAQATRPGCVRWVRRVAATRSRGECARCQRADEKL